MITRPEVTRCVGVAVSEAPLTLVERFRIMMSQENRLLPLTSETLDRPLRDLAAAPMTAPAAAVSASEPAHLREYLAVVLKRKWLIISLAIVVTSLVAIQMYRTPSIYEATTQIQIEQKPRSALTTGRGGESVIIRGNDPNYWNTQLQKLKTQRLARQVIMRLDLQNNPNSLSPAHRGTGIIAGLRRIFTGYKAPGEAERQQDASAIPVIDEVELSADNLTPEQSKKLEPYEDALRENLSVDPIDRTNLVNIRFVHTDPQIASNVANTLAAIFRENDIRAETSGSQKAEDVLANQIIDLQARVQADEAARLNYKRQHDLPLGPKQGQDLTAAQLGAYLSQMQGAEQRRKQVEAAYKSALETRNT